MFKAHKNDFLLAGTIGFASGFFGVVSLACVRAQAGLLMFVFTSLLFPVLTVCGLAVGLVLARSRPLFFQIVKFGMVGGFNTLLELAVVNVLIVFTNASGGLSFVAFKTVSFLMAAMSAYFWNKNWTFGNRARSSMREFTVFAVGGFLGLVINVSVATFLVSWVGPRVGFAPILWLNLSVIIAVLVGMTWNFLFQRRMIFRSKVVSPAA